MFRKVFDKAALNTASSDLLEVLLKADFGYAIASEVARFIQGKAQDRERFLREHLEEKLSTFDSALRLTSHPSVILVVGVNGVGKTATAGKLANLLRLHNKKVLLAAADTFRAAAVEQLNIWAERAGASITLPVKPGVDPASVAFSSVQRALDEGHDIVIVDTAGRLHNNTNLMGELDKIKRVIQKLATIDEVLLVLDATTGQNGLVQARVFSEIIGITGIALSKTDSSSKAGFVFQVQEELKVPVKLIGTGEGISDIAGFTPHAFVAQLF